MDSQTIRQYLDTLQPYIIGAIFGSIGTFLTGFAKEIFDERARKKKHKLDIARQVLKICNEASTNNFKQPPRSIEHVYSVLTDLEGINKKMSIEMEKFVSSWQIMTNPNDIPFSDKGKYFPDELNRAEEKRKTLIEWANKIRTGNLL